MFAYCLNNPVNVTDSNGNDPYGILTLFDKAVIHGMVQLKCAIDNLWVREIYVRGAKGKGFLDLYDPSNNSYYEVKSKKEAEKTRTKTQMAKYDVAKVQDTAVNRLKLDVINSNDVITRGKIAVSGTIQYGIHDVEYRLESPGLIVYDTKVNWERAAATAALAVLIVLQPEAVVAAPVICGIA